MLDGPGHYSSTVQVNMLIRLMSDLHLEFGDYAATQLPEDKETTLVLAGDITVASNTIVDAIFIEFMGKCSEQFKQVVMILGNHEHYDGTFHKTADLVGHSVSHLRNVHILDNDVFLDIDAKVAFIGATLWTDCGTLNDMTPNTHLWHGMPESRIVKYGEKKMSIDDVRNEYLASRDFIFDRVEKCKAWGYKTVVISHHLPSAKSVHKNYVGHPMNIFFNSDMDLDILEANPKLWLHGHTHSACDYMLDKVIGDTRIVCNPRGYHGAESPPESRGFNPNLILEI